jgi:hypothetical protein
VAGHVAPLDPQSAAVASAILIGDRGAIAADEERRLQEAGTYPVIAITDGNMALPEGMDVRALQDYDAAVAAESP